MPFLCLHGTVRLVNRDQAGRETGFEPDGDSIHFKPKTPRLLDELPRLRLPYRLTRIGSVNLRMEGIDALELHYSPATAGGGSTHQPRPLADEARNALTGLLGMNPIDYVPPRDVRVDPPVRVDGVRGFILSRSLEVHGRPVVFLFKGAAPFRDGAEAFIDTPLLRKSLNHQMVTSGSSYPLFYDTLFKSLRDELARAAKAARAARRGLWPLDKTKAGFAMPDLAGLQITTPIFPKLFRRAADYFSAGHRGVAEFLEWLAARARADARSDRLLEPNGNFTHLDNILRIRAGKLSMKYEPEDIVFISEKT